MTRPRKSSSISFSIPTVANGLVTVSLPTFNGLGKTSRANPKLNSPIDVTPAAVQVLPTEGSASKSKPTLLSKYLEAVSELDAYRNGKPVMVDGHTLSVAAVTAASRLQASVELDSNCSATVTQSRSKMAEKVDNGISVYGVSTGFGGSANTRTDQPLVLGHALLQMQHIGVLPSTIESPEVSPLMDPLNSTSMPEAWVRGAMVVRMNSLIRGHSGVRWELIEKMKEILDADIIPLVPLRGSISASGDLSPLSYIAGTVCGNPSIRVFSGPRKARKIVSAQEALATHNIKPLSLASKEPLGILNGTAFSAAVGALVLSDAVQLCMLSAIMTAMGTEALAGTRLSFHPFIHDVTRPHPGQVETARMIWDLLEDSQFAVIHEEEVTIKEDNGKLRQDRYPLRTAPQFIGPQVEDLLCSMETVTLECNSTTDNPLIDGKTGTVHHGGNFQAMAVTNAMEKTRLSLHHLGKLMFAQCAELMDPGMNRGLPPNLSATDPSLDYHCKGIDIATAAYVAELGYLANPVSTHIQSAEMHNQAVNSLALISARQTLHSLEVLSILMASYLYAICQALDLRAMQKEFLEKLNCIVRDEATRAFGSPNSPLSTEDVSRLTRIAFAAMEDSLDDTTTMDNAERMIKVAASCTTVVVDFVTAFESGDVTSSASMEAPRLGLLAAIPSFRAQVSSRAAMLMNDLRREYLSGQRGGAPARRYLNKTRPMYEFVRVTLGIRMHGSENLKGFANGHGVDEQTVGQNVSLIYEAIRDRKMQPVIASLFNRN